MGCCLDPCWAGPERGELLQNLSSTSSPPLQPSHTSSVIWRRSRVNVASWSGLFTQQEDDCCDASLSERSVVVTSEEKQLSESSFIVSDVLCVCVCVCVCVCGCSAQTDYRLWCSTSICHVNNGSSSFTHSIISFHTKTLKCKFRNTPTVSLLSVSEKTRLLFKHPPSFTPPCTGEELTWWHGAVRMNSLCRWSEQSAGARILVWI